MSLNINLINKNLSFDFDAQYGQWSISSLNFPGFSLQGIKTKIYLNNRWITLFERTPESSLKEISKKDRELIIEDRRKDFIVCLRLSFPEQIPAVFLEMEIRNNSPEDMTLGSFHLLDV